MPRSAPNKAYFERGRTELDLACFGLLMSTIVDDVELLRRLADAEDLVFLFGADAQAVGEQAVAPGWSSPEHGSWVMFDRNRVFSSSARRR
jgi:hypothetical protein